MVLEPFIASLNTSFQSNFKLRKLVFKIYSILFLRRFLKQYCPIKIRFYFLCPFVLIQKNEKIKSRLKPFGENLSATDTRKECTLWRTNVKRFSVSVPPLNFLLPHFANRAPDSTKPLSLFIKFQFFKRGKGLSIELRYYL
jgi:hypothetical protein